jgi:SAM-dependent MidA family methyltransferase
MLRGVARRLRPPPALRAASGAASASAEQPPEAPPLLLRDFLFDRLYHPRLGYFTARHGSVGALPAPLPFKHLLNRSEYLARVEAAYREAGVSWFTPVELFQPWYARALARHILRLHGASATPLHVYELGGGGGTAARGILDAVRELAPEVYRGMRYTAVEVSAQLAARQAAAVAAAGHAARYTVERRDAADVAGWGGQDAAPCFVLALEVLDNLPHDRVVRRSGGGGGGDEDWLETRVAGVRDAPEAPPAPPAAEAAAPRGRERARALASAVQRDASAAAANGEAAETLREVLVPLAGAPLL